MDYLLCPSFCFNFAETRIAHLFCLRPGEVLFLLSCSLLLLAVWFWLLESNSDQIESFKPYSLVQVLVTKD